MGDGREDADRVAIYDDTIGKYDKLWGGNEFLYHIHNTRTMHWNIGVSNINVGLVNQV